MSWKDRLKKRKEAQLVSPQETPPESTEKKKSKWKKSKSEPVATFDGEMPQPVPEPEPTPAPVAPVDPFEEEPEIVLEEDSVALAPTLPPPPRALERKLHLSLELERILLIQTDECDDIGFYAKDDVDGQEGLPMMTLSCQAGCGLDILEQLGFEDEDIHVMRR